MVQFSLISSRHANDSGPGDDYLYIGWGNRFYALHVQRYPDHEQPALVGNPGGREKNGTNPGHDVMQV